MSWNEESIHEIQLNLCQKLLFLHQLSHNTTTDCSLNYEFSTQKLQAQNMHKTCSEYVVYTNCFLFLFWHSEQFMYTTCYEHVLSFQFSCTELVIQCTIFSHIVGWCKNKCFWNRFTCMYSHARITQPEDQMLTFN